jgi:hypothetical protein
MVNKKHKQASAYLDAASYDRIAALARRHGRTLSEHLRQLIEREIVTGGLYQDDLLSNLMSIEIGVDALIRNHPNEGLYKVVAEVREARLKGASNEA